MSVRVRYAPSPTGSPHVGNIRTALYNYLFARRHKGVNILRIEDTDRSRLVEGCEAEIMQSMRYVGIDWQEGPTLEAGELGDFGPYRQSQRNEAGIYRPYWQQLLDGGHAYWAFDTAEELTEMREHQAANKLATGYFGGIWRDASNASVEKAQNDGLPGVIRLKIPRDQKITVNDAIRGEIEYDSNVLDDPVLIKADGMPTYHFAAMVDDHLMEITHIFRGEEWIGSAPKHIVLFQAFGWTPPVLVHLPVIKGKDGSKLSKRHGDTACLDFQKAGFTGEALANFIALIGWSPGDDREVLTLDEMAEAFDLKGVQPSSGVFDSEKLNWMSGMHIRQSSVETLGRQISDYVQTPGLAEFWDARPDAKVNMEGLNALASSLKVGQKGLEAIGLLHERATNLSDFGEGLAFVFEAPHSYDEKGVAKWFGEESTIRVLQAIIDLLGTKDKPQKSKEDFETMIRELKETLGLEGLGPIVHPVRIALTGKTAGPGLFELMAVLGADEVSARLATTLDSIKKSGPNLSV